jgi:hypothetical protein
MILFGEILNALKESRPRGAIGLVAIASFTIFLSVKA